MTTARKWISFKSGLIPLIISNIALIILGMYSWGWYDVRYFVEWVSIAKTHGILYIYEYARKAAYPPVPILLFTGLHWFAISITSSEPLIRLIDKIPFIIAYNLIYYLLREKYGLRAGLYWLASFVPYEVMFIYQFDLLPSLFILLATYEFLKPDRSPIRTAIYLSLAALCKQLLVLLALIPLIIYYREKRINALKKYVLTGLLIGLLTILPFLIVDPSAFINKILLYHSRRYPQELSLWAIPLYLYNYDYTKLPLWITYAWTPIYLVVITYFFYKVYRLEKYDNDTILRLFTIFVLISLILNKVNNFNYLAWITPLLIIILTSKNSQYSGLRLLFIAIQWIVGNLYPLTTFFAATVVGGSVLLVEDLQFYSAPGIFERSVDHSMTLLYMLIDYSRIYLYNFFNILYRGMGISATIYVIIYNAFIAHLLYRLVREISWR